MRKTSLVLAGVALAFTVGTAYAQADMDAGMKQTTKRKLQNSANYDKTGSAKYRPLTVQAPPPAEGTASNSLSQPIGASVGLASGIGAVGTGVVGGAVTGATSIIAAPFQALGGGPVGISPNAAPPLPIKARYANTGKVFSSYDEGYAQDVPVDASGPIYKIDDKAYRNVTPFTLLAFPVTGAVSAITTPFRPATP